MTAQVLIWQQQVIRRQQEQKQRKPQSQTMRSSATWLLDSETHLSGSEIAAPQSGDVHPPPASENIQALRESLPVLEPRIDSVLSFRTGQATQLSSGLHILIRSYTESTATPNDRSQSRRTNDAQHETETRIRRPLHSACWAHGWAQGKLGVNRCVIAYTNITDRPRPPIPPQMPNSAAQRSGATNRHRRSMNQLNTPLLTRARNANGNVHTESYSDINSRMSTAVPKQHGRNTAMFPSRRKNGCSVFMAVSAPNG